MKFRDIPRFTRIGSYAVNMSLEYLSEWIEKEKREYDLQMNPDFQRAHVWTEDQQVKFVEFILRGGQTGRDLYFNHPGWMGNFKGEFVCVDGKQRITAIQRFLDDKIRAFGQTYSEFGGPTSELDHTMIVHVNNLQTRAEVLQWYIEMNTGGTPHADEEIARVCALLKKEQQEEIAPPTMEMGM